LKLQRQEEAIWEAAQKGYLQIRREHFREVHEDIVDRESLSIQSRLNLVGHVTPDIKS